VKNNKNVDNDELVEIEKKVNKSEDKEICYSLHSIHFYEQKFETKVSVDYVNIYIDEKKKPIVYDGRIEHQVKSIDHPIYIYNMSNNLRQSFVFLFIHFFL
jgi:hypothetical protein